MSLRLKQYSPNGIEQPEWTDITWDVQTEVSPDGYNFTFGSNEVKNFLDDGLATALAANSGADSIALDAIPFGSALS